MIEFRRKTKAKLSRRTLDDLKLWLDFLKSARAGISINIIIFRKPTLATSSDSSEYEHHNSKTKSNSTA